MNKNLKFFYTVLIAVFLLVSGSGIFLASNSDVIPLVSSSTGFSTTIVIHNNLSKATPSPYDEMIVVNSLNYSTYENANLSNIWFSNANGARIPSWLQSGNSNSDHNTTYWLRINSSIADGGTLQIRMNFLPLGSSSFNNYSTGEAPQFTNVYGIYDDGSHVFNFYDNFSGTSIKGSIWANAVNSGFIVNNGITFTSQCHFLNSTLKYNSSGEVEAYGIMNTPNLTGQTSFFLGGAGFGNRNISCASPVMTAGWAENDSNMLGLSVWNGNGATYTYNVSKSINPNVDHIFGVGYINGSTTTISIDNVLQNISHTPLGIPGNRGLNVVMGFQSGNFPEVNHFYWIFERNATSDGYNLPYNLHQAFPVRIIASGLPAGNAWSVSIQNVGTFGYAVSGQESLDLVNGTYNLTIAAMNGYIAYPSTLNFTVNGSPTTLYVAFESPSNRSLIGAEMTLFPLGQFFGPFPLSYPGYNLQEFPAPLGYTAMALDNNSNSLFISFYSFGGGGIADINLTSGTEQVRLLSNFTTQLGMYYNPSNGYLYAPNQNGLSIIDASNFHFVKNVTLSHTTVLSLTASTDGSIIYLLSDNTTGKANITSINQTGKILGNLSFPGFESNSLQIGNLIEPPVYFNGDLIVTNNTGIFSFNLTGGAENFVQAPPKYEPLSLLPYGSSGDFLVGGNNGSQKSSYVYNATNGKFISGPPISGFITASAYNSFSGDYYFWSGSNTLFSGNITEVNPTTGKILAVSPAPALTSMLLFDPSSQSLFAMDYFVDFSYGAISMIYEYSVQHDYKATFTENGLGSGAWYVNVTGEPSSGPIYGNTYSTYLPNGTYSYSVSAADKQYSPSFSSTFTISGNPMTEPTAFSLVNYTVTFIESGLPSGTWYVNLSGTLVSASAGYTISYNEPNNTYSVHIYTDNKLYHLSSYSGSVAVSGKSITITVSFVPTTYSYTFIESGLPANSTWTITIDNVSHSVNGSTYVAQLQNGTYHYSVSAGGYSANNQTGTIEVSGGANTTHVTFSRIPSYGTYYLAGGGIAAAAVIIAALLWWRRKGQSK